MQLPALDLRQEHFLGAVVDAYVRTATPIGSRALSRDPNASLSPASIRGIFAELEASGCLYRPHRSSGRVPTDVGYRYYVDRLMVRRDVGEADRRRLERMIARVADGATAGIRALVEDFAGLVGQLTFAAGVEAGRPWVMYAGACHIVVQPEFSIPAQLAPIFAALDGAEAVAEMLPGSASESAVVVRIGRENPLEAMRTCALVGVRINQRSPNTLAILGPTRMDYPAVVSRLAAFHAMLNAMLETGSAARGRTAPQRTLSRRTTRRRANPGSATPQPTRPEPTGFEPTRSESMSPEDAKPRQRT